MTLRLDPPQSLLQARQERRKAQRRRAVLIAAIACLVVGGLVYLFAFASVFTVDRVRVQGTDRLPAEQVRAVLAEHRGAQLALLNTSKLAAQVERIPAVAGAQVHVVWPGTVAVAVDERPSLGVVEAGGKRLSLDDTGTLFAIDGVAPVGPSISVPDGDGADVALAQAAATLVALPKDVRDAVVSVEATSPDDVRLELTGKRTVVWGNAADSDRKAAVLDVLLTQGSSWFDVSTPTAPLTREKPPTQDR